MLQYSCSLPSQSIAVAPRRLLPQAAAECILLLQDDVDLVALLPFQKMLQLALEPLLIGSSGVTGQEVPAARQPDAHDADNILSGAGMTQDHLAGRLRAGAELQSGSELHEGLQTGPQCQASIAHAGVLRLL